jgi:1-acyl-sn-glycerol-3-phosphate acyltransferase
MIKAENLGKQVPRRGNAFTQRLGEFWLQSIGWKVVGVPPEAAYAVLIGAPHTSNKDGFLSAAVALALRLDVRVMAKAELFKGPLAYFFRWMGVIPVYRDKPGGLVEQSVAYLREDQPFYLGISPEGTRHCAKEFKRGFYIIAQKAQVPIIPFAMDYENKEIRLTHAIFPTGDMDAVIGADISKMSLPLKAMLPPEKLKK